MVIGALLSFIALFTPLTTAPSSYSTKKNFDQKISRSVKTYVVFGADWCAPCVKLKRLLSQAGIAKKVVFLNASKEWVANILLSLEYPGIPYTVVYKNGRSTGVVRMGKNSSLIFLLANVQI